MYKYTFVAQIKFKNMKYILTGSLGHISKPLAEKLIAENHDVTIISSKIEKTGEIEALGAKAAIGSVEDVAFLTSTFNGADAVYTMIPPYFGAVDWKQHIGKIGKNYGSAIKTAGVKNVVNLSSIGAHMPTGCGQVSGLYVVEQELNALPDTNVLHLRPGFFFYNFLNNIGMIKHMGIIGGNYGEGSSLVLTNPDDISAIAARELLSLSNKGKNALYIIGDIKTTDEIASILGKAIEKPDLKWVNFTDADTKAALQQNGLPPDVAGNFTEMGAAMRSGAMMEDYYAKNAGITGKIRFDSFAGSFAEAYSKM